MKNTQPTPSRSQFKSHDSDVSGGRGSEAEVELQDLSPSTTLEDVIGAVKAAGYIPPRKFAADTAITIKFGGKLARPSYDASSPEGLALAGCQTPIEWLTEYLRFHKLTSHPLAYEIQSTAVTVYGNEIKLPELEGGISFMRTLRVPDDEGSYTLPPGLGNFPLLPVKPFAHNLPKNIGERGGLFFPMYQREALWINLPEKSNRDAALKIAVGGVNAVSGLPHNSEDIIRSRTQDYLVVGRQPWLDGIATEPGTVKQFVAMPLGQGYTVEEQVLGSTHGGIQIDVLPSLNRYVSLRRVSSYGISAPLAFHAPVESQLRPGEDLIIQLLEVPDRFGTWHTMAERLTRLGLCPLTAIYNNIRIAVVNLIGTRTTFDVDLDETMCSLKSRIQGKEGIPSDQQRLIYSGKQLEDLRSFREYGISDQAVIHLVPRLRGGGYIVPETPQMGIAAGGRIEQKIYEDTPEKFASYSRRPFQRIFVHAVSTRTWELATGTLAPSTSIDRTMYKRERIPWFTLYDEHIAGIPQGGQFRGVRSIDQIDYEIRPAKRARLAVGDKTTKLDPDAPPLCDTCTTHKACVVARPCSHCICKHCLPKAVLGGSTCLECSSPIFGYVGFKTPALKNISSDDPAFKITDVFIDAPPIDSHRSSTSAITLHLPQDEPQGLNFGRKGNV